MMKLLALLFLIQLGMTETVYQNKLYQVSCIKSTDVDGGLEYTLYGQNSKYQHISDMLELYSGDDIVGFMEEVSAFIELAKPNDSKKIEGVLIHKEPKGFYIYPDKGFKGFNLKAWNKMKDNIKNKI